MSLEIDLVLVLLSETVTLDQTTMHRLITAVQKEWCAMRARTLTTYHSSISQFAGWLLPKLSTFSLRAGVLAQDVEASLCGYGRTVIFCVAAVAVAVFGALFKAAALVAA